MAEDVQVRVEDRHIEAARLYLKGPVGLKGNWSACCKRAGFKRTPALENATSQAAIEEARALDADPDPDVLRLEEMLDQENVDWEEVAPLARKILSKIGMGSIDANTGQISALKEIINRAEGKVGRDSGSGGPLGVVVLPAMLDHDKIPWVPEDADVAGD